jgi:hypothetical protein
VEAEVEISLVMVQKSVVCVCVSVCRKRETWVGLVVVHDGVGCGASRVVKVRVKGGEGCASEICLCGLRDDKRIDHPTLCAIRGVVMFTAQVCGEYLSERATRGPRINGRSLSRQDISISKSCRRRRQHHRHPSIAAMAQRHVCPSMGMLRRSLHADISPASTSSRAFSSAARRLEDQPGNAPPSPPGPPSTLSPCSQWLCRRTF